MKNRKLHIMVATTILMILIHFPIRGVKNPMSSKTGLNFSIFSLELKETAKTGMIPEELEADKILYNKAKAVIHTEQGDLVLRGEKILYSKKENLLTGYSAFIIDLQGKKHGKNNTIKVFLEKPLEFKIE